ncbi:uncharacterized protein [Oscarella lobularis]|uniref:uncharacterized protein n=1 Tax=Oscarella lobularis TaxID=121494 RepID=UPI0033141C39
MWQALAAELIGVCVSAAIKRYMDAAKFDALMAEFEKRLGTNATRYIVQVTKISTEILDRSKSNKIKWCSFLIRTTIALVENFKGISEGRDFVERLKAAKDEAENVAEQLVQDFLEAVFENVAQAVGCQGKLPKFLERTLSEQFVSQMKNFYTFSQYHCTEELQEELEELKEVTRFYFGEPAVNCLEDLRQRAEDISQDSEKFCNRLAGWYSELVSANLGKEKGKEFIEEVLLLSENETELKDVVTTENLRKAISSKNFTKHLPGAKGAPTLSSSVISVNYSMTSFDAPPSCVAIPCLDTAKRCLGKNAWKSASIALSGAPKISADSSAQTAANWFSDRMIDLVKEFSGEVMANGFKRAIISGSIGGLVTGKLMEEATKFALKKYGKKNPVDIKRISRRMGYIGAAIGGAAAAVAAVTVLAPFTITVTVGSAAIYTIPALTTSLTLGQLVGFAATGGISGFLTYFAANVLTDITPNLY